MFRKLTTILAAAAVIFAMLPAVAASAAASGTANLLGTTTVFPSATDADPAMNTPFTIQVRNTQQPISLSGLGTTINGVRITFPPNVGVPVCPAPPPGGFTCVTFGQPGAEGIALQGGAIMPGGSLNIPFQGTVNAPRNNDRGDAFRVQVTDGTGFSTANGNLTLNVRALEILQPAGESGISVAATRASDTFDAANRVTSGQPTTATYTVKNHAQEVLGVNALLRPVERTTPRPFTQPAARGGTSDAVFDVSTAGVPTGTTTVQLQTDASSPNATTVARTQQLLIDAPVTLDVGGLTQGIRRTIANGLTLGLTLTATKSNPPRVDDLDTSITLTSADFPGDDAITATATNAVGAGAQNLTLDFGQQSIGFDSIDQCRQAPRPSGCRLDGLYPVDATISQTGFDSNGALVTYTETIRGLFLIDIAAPFISLVAGVADYADTAAADRFKQGDTISISGTVRTAEGSTTVPDDVDAASLAVSVGGREVTNASYNAQTGNFTASYAVPIDESTPTFGLEGFVDVTASISDLANNSQQASVPLIVDNVAPALSPSLVVDHDGNAQTAPLNSPLAYLVDGDLYGQSAEYVVRAAFQPGGGTIVPQLKDDPVAGGCSPTQWRVDNATVVDVLYWNGEPCEDGQAAPPLDQSAPAGSSQNDRIIVVLEDIDPQSLPVNLTYSDEGVGLGGIFVDPVTDLVRNEAIREVASVLNGLKPLLPNIIRFERIDTEPADANPDGEYEAVGQSDRNGQTAYHFNTDDIRFTLTQVTVGDLLEFRDAVTGELLGDVAMGQNGEFTVTNELLDREVSGLLPGRDAERQISLRYRRSIPGQVDALGDFATLTLVYDLTAPALAAITAEPVVTDNGDGTASVPVFFTEALASGTDDPNYLTALYVNQDAAEGDNPYLAHLTNNVTADPEDRTRRVLTIETGGRNIVDAFEYEFLDFGDGSVRYEDLAGNLTGANSFVAQ